MAAPGPVDRDAVSGQVRRGAVVLDRVWRGGSDARWVEFDEASWRRDKSAGDAAALSRRGDRPTGREPRSRRHVTRPRSGLGSPA
ncbi:hypothetical protein ADL03_30770 [Nocardia sp. NRRL S-836]|nr:hypothetical protein ADL03_30770 [Nocardia sp. NRRL S-836]